MTIKIFTNEINGGWSPEDLETSLGGSEEAIVQFASELSKKEEVIVYHTQKEPGDISYNGVTYKDRNDAKCYDTDIFITYKDSKPWINGAKCKKMIHWTTEVERPWDVSTIDSYVNISNFHKTRNNWVTPSKNLAIPLGVDTLSLDKNKIEQDKDSILYCSSPDRGLVVLLNNWQSIKSKFPNLKLRIAYGFEYIVERSNNNPNALKFRDNIMKMMEQPDIEYLGALSKDDIEKEYWKNQYWILPLQNPDSELFCLNAVKSRYCGATSIVNKIGALKNTVGDYIPYADFVSGNMDIINSDALYDASGWEHIVEQYWSNILYGEKKG